MDELSLTKMADNELWDLHQSIVAILALKLETRKSELDRRLARLRAITMEQKASSSRRLYRTASPKFRNPTQPEQTWSGKGKRPRWMTELLNAGMSIREFQIDEMTSEI